MTSNLFLGKPSLARVFLVLIAVFCLSTVGMARQDDTLDKTKDILIDEPADKIEDVFDEETYDDDDVYEEEFMEETYREKPSTSPSDACVMQEKADACAREQATEACPKAQATTDWCAQAGTSERPLEVELRDLYDHPEEYFGQTVTVKAEIDDTFNENVFTIQDNGYESMVIKRGAACNAVELDGDEWKDGTTIHVTGVVEPFDRDKLECNFGPLDMESKEGDLFTRSPVLIVRELQTAELAPPPVITHEPEIITEAPPPEPIVPEEEEEVFIAILQEPVQEEPEEPEALPRTASPFPLAGLAGLLSLVAAAGFGFYRR